MILRVMLMVLMVLFCALLFGGQHEDIRSTLALLCDIRCTCSISFYVGLLRVAVCCLFFVAITANTP